MIILLLATMKTSTVIMGVFLMVVLVTVVNAGVNKGIYTSIFVYTSHKNNCRAK